MQMIIFRLVQGVGGAFLMSNSTAFLTDAPLPIPALDDEAVERLAPRDASGPR